MSPMAKALAIRCGRPHSEEPCCPRRTRFTKGRCPRCRGSSSCGHGPASSPTAVGAASRLSSRAGGAHTPPAAFVAAQRLENAPFLGDAWFYRALSALGQGTTRLLETHDGTPLPLPPPLSDSQLFARLQLRLTGTGDDALRGEADRVELLGIDRWIGGTHLTPDNAWRWDPTEPRLVRPFTST
ncbi:MAG: hypothetical protein QOI43_674, partial [Gaiellales bacterium]|nr:hypothetical protein [Gaiellales bacterium]